MRRELAAAVLLAAAAVAGRRASGEEIDLLGRTPTVSGGGPIEGEPPLARREDELVLQFGARASWRLELPPRAVLAAERAFARGSATGRLEVSWTPDGARGRSLCADLSALGAPRVAVGNAVRERGRLTIAASARSVADARGAGMVLVGPRLDEAGPAPAAVPTRRPPAKGPNVVLFLVDALRADRVGCYGSGRGATPSMDRFAGGAVVFENAQAQAPWTWPAVASIFTGLWPQQHDVDARGGRLPREAVTLAELLSGAGVATAAFVANGNLAADAGWAQGFGTWKHLREVRAGEYHARPEDVVEAVLDGIDRETRRPFFVYAHTLGPHAPYGRREPYHARFAGSVFDAAPGSLEWQRRLERTGEAVSARTVADVGALYDAEVAENDAAFGELVDGLARRRLLDATVVVLLADHGEELFDHGRFGHGLSLHAEVLDVPLLARFPHGQPARRVSEVVEQVDLLPTILSLYGLRPPSYLPGRSLLPLCSGTSRGWKGRAVSHVGRVRRAVAASWLDARWKLILRQEEVGAVPLLFDRRADRAERRDLAAERPDVVVRLRSALAHALASEPGGLPRPPAEAPLDEEMRKQLRALGYLQ